MSGKTTYLTISDFTDQATIDQSNDRCTFNNLIFRKKDSWKDYQIKDVLDICKKHHIFNMNTLIIKNEDELTLWIEDKAGNIPSQGAKQSPESQDISATNKSTNSQSLPTKTVTKRYRGQVYEEVVVDWSAIQNNSQQNKPRRKYRGQYIN